jgi:spore coat protein U-like protein
MKSFIAPTLLLLLAGLGAPSWAFAHGCQLALSTPGILLNWNTNFTFQAVQLTISKLDSDACNYAISFSNGTASDYNRRMVYGLSTLRYQLYKDASLSQILKERPDASVPANVITGSFGGGAGQSRSHTYYVQVPQDLATTPALKPSGNYLDIFTVRAYDLRNGNELDDLEAASSVVIATSVPKVLDLSIVPSGGAFNESSTSYSVNFGALAGEDTRAFDLRVRSNAGFRVFFSSQNGGKLKHATAPGTIPYTLKVDSSAQSLGSSATLPVLVAAGVGQTSLSGVGKAVSITTGDISQSLAGTYADYITVTAMTTE